jgi:hypothetical protein
MVFMVFMFGVSGDESPSICAGNGGDDGPVIGRQ